VEEVSDSMEKAVVEMKHTLTRELRDWRERLMKEKRRQPRVRLADDRVEPAEDDPEPELMD
jgi:hypothetical protein